jgi:hypothetical protein
MRVCGARMNGSSLHAFWLGELWHPLKGLGYQFWSGVGSDFSEITLLGAIIAWWHHVNCIEKGCWRKGHPNPEHGHPVCRKHTRHPHPAFTTPQCQAVEDES